MLILKGCQWRRRFTGLLWFLATAAGAAPLSISSETLRLDDDNHFIAPLIRSESAVLYRADEGRAKFNHHPHLEVFQDRLFAMWSSGAVDEDSSSQQVLYNVSQDGLKWSEPAVFAADPDGTSGTLRLTAGGWWSDGKKLMGCYTVFDGRPATGTPGDPGVVKWLGDLNVMARQSADGINWTDAREIARDFLVNDGPRRTPSGTWLMTGEEQNGRPRLLKSNAPDALSEWADIELKLPKLRRPLNELTWFIRQDGGLTLVFRDDNGSRRLYAATMNTDFEQTSEAQKTNFPDARAKARGGNLPGGEAVLISNPSPSRSRIPLAMAVLRDADLADRVFGIRGEKTFPRYSGKNKGPGYHYPDIAVWRDYLYVIYSINKEDIGVSRIALDLLRAEMESGR